MSGKSGYARIYAYYEDGVSIRVLADSSLWSDYENYLNNYKEVDWESYGVTIADVDSVDDVEIMYDLADAEYLTVGDVK